MQIFRKYKEPLQLLYSIDESCVPAVAGSHEMGDLGDIIQMRFN